MTLKNISLNIKLLFIVTLLFSIFQFAKNDTKVNHHLLNYTGLIPMQYDVVIELDFNRNILHAECNITINITRPVTNINIPSVNFGILRIDLIINDNNRMIHVPRYSFINETHINIDFTNMSINILLPGTYILHMIYFRNIFGGILLGYEEDIGEKVLTETGVEVIRAQQIFPCWDEPVFESTFIISIMHHMKFKVLSNMFINKTEYINESNMIWTHFHKSPFMSIQRLTIVITTFNNIFLQHTMFARATIWYRRSMARNVEFAQTVIEHVFDFLYAKCQTKIQKIDYVAIWDVQHSDIETWGLILHREKDITYIDALDSVAHKIKVANLVARQVISVWYDYVTWPIEGFATYFAANILGKLSSISYIHDLFVVQVLQESLRFDIPSYNYNSTLHNNSGSDVIINNIFHNYIKSSVLWYILPYILNEDIWNSIRIYVAKYNQPNRVETNDLLFIMQTYLDTQTSCSLSYDLKKYINIWIKKNYYPVVYATLNATDDTISFSYLSSHYIDEDKEQLPAFLTFTIIQKKINNTFQTFSWFLPQNKELIRIRTTFNVFDNNYCVIVNVNQTGYYRVNYNSEGWLRLAQCLNKNYTVHVLNHAQVIDDAFHFLIHRRLNTIMFWNIVSFLSENANYVAWYPMIKAFEYMACVYSLTISITTNMEKILNGVLQIIGYDEKFYESDLTKCLREEVAKWACIIDAAKCRATATLQLMKDLNNPIVVNRFTWNEWKYCKGLMSANYTVCNYTWKKWTTTSDNRILDYLTCCRDPSFIIFYLNQTITLIKDKYFIKEQNKLVNIVLLTVAKHVEDITVFDFILTCLENEQLVLSRNWQIDTISILIISITHMNSVHQLQKINSFATIYLKKKRLVDAVKNKIKKRILQHTQKIAKYGSLGLHDNN